MRKRFLILQLALGLTAAAQIGPPSLGVAVGDGRQVLEIQGIPEAWVARPTPGTDLAPEFDGSADAAASSSAQLCWASQGVLHIRDKRTNKVAAYQVPEGDARFAFDATGQLAAAWFLSTGEVYAGAAGWTAVYISPDGAAPLDLTAQSRALLLLYRSADGLHRTRIDAGSGNVLAEAKLADRPGPALLDSGGNAVFATSSGLSEVDSMRRVEQGWMLLSTAHGRWIWQPGKLPQGVPTTSGATPALQLWLPNGSEDVGATVALPDTPVGSTTQVEYILANEASTDIYLSTFHLTTTAPFRLDSAPHPPWEIGAGLMQGFFLDFSPTSVGAATPSSLTLNYCYASDFDSTNDVCPTAATLVRSIAITGNGIAAPASGPWLTGISPESNMAGAPDFTLFINGGGFTSTSTALWNGTPLVTTFISSVQLSAAVPASLLTVPVDVSVTVSNPPGGTANVTKAWTFHVYSSVTPSISLYDQNDAPLTSSQITSNMTVRVRAKLDQAATTSLSGVLELGFQSAVSSVASDQTIALGSPGSDQQVGSIQTFTVPAGSTTALFGNADYVAMTTGTTAGTITLDLALQYALPVTPQNYVINPVPPVIVTSSKVFTANSAVLTFQGYDDTRSLSSVVFTFHTASGAVVSPGAMTVDLTQNFATYFQTNSQIGGSFVLTATFPVTGDITQINSVTTEFTNSAGTTSAKQ
jgi:hypothetical protein